MPVMRLLLMSFIIPLYAITSLDTGECIDRVKGKWRMELIDTSLYTVIRDEEKINLLAPGSRPATLSATEINKIDVLLRKAVSDYNRNPENSDLKIDSFHTYKRQLVTYVNPSGDKIVWINCCCYTWGQDWKKIIIEVSDGGSCYFNLTINLTGKQVSTLRVNGLG
jgi:hypothetical protein